MASSSVKATRIGKNPRLQFDNIEKNLVKKSLKIYIQRKKIQKRKPDSLFEKPVQYAIQFLTGFSSADQEIACPQLRAWLRARLCAGIREEKEHWESGTAVATYSAPETLI